MNNPDPLNQTKSDDDSHSFIDRRLFRGLGWLAIALLGAFVLAHYVGMTEYWQRWAGSLFKAATGGWGGFRISRDICRIDPSSQPEGMPTAIAHLARAILVGATILAICLAV